MVVKGPSAQRTCALRRAEGSRAKARRAAVEKARTEARLLRGWVCPGASPMTSSPPPQPTRATQEAARQKAEDEREAAKEKSLKEAAERKAQSGVAVPTRPSALHVRPWAGEG